MVIFYYFFYFVCLMRFLFSIFHSDFCLYKISMVYRIILCINSDATRSRPLFVSFVLRHLEKQQKIRQKIEMDHAHFLSFFDISFFALDHFIIFISISMFLVIIFHWDFLTWCRQSTMHKHPFVLCATLNYG